MAEWVKVLLLGIIEGVTEFLPVSSTGHLIISAEFMQLRDSLDGTFEIFIQIGAVFAVLFYYRVQLWQQLFALPANSSVQKLWLGVFIAFIPAAVIGLLLGDLIDRLLFNPLVVAGALIVGGLLFLVVERLRFSDNAEKQRAEKQRDEKQKTENTITVRQAVIVGLWQVLALIPGMSRSGMSIIGGMLAGLDRQDATQFSFYLAIPTLGAATVYTLLSNLDEISQSDLVLLLLGAVISAVVAWLSIGWLLRYVSSNNFIPFGYYRIAVGLLILLVVLF